MASNSVHSKKTYTDQMFVLVWTQLRNYVDTQAVKRYKCYVMYMRY